LNSITDAVPYEFSLKFLVDNKTSEYDLIEFFHTAKGKAYRFWLEYPSSQFNLKVDQPSGASSISCEPNGFEKVGEGYERIFIALKSGDTIVRNVTSSAYDSGTEILSLVLDTPLDREVATTDYWLIGRYLLCRFDSDNFKQKMRSVDVSEFELGFVELPLEYDEEEAS
jgi:hypothetical protein